ncbi:oligopeptide transporter [Dacryopinax primogenitus]|uniref:Oligopeptide transporter n=1 Tax=Dacryopinax primogenitus (strain DJM 731) TaxID=1858805 RepID=M5FRK8_DACPD|nr:oligopeptide transporter [Dacryopinax primogenitus]EJT98338.1 oligopeptide transporter [Dacryopinax primogenitus]
MSHEKLEVRPNGDEIINVHGVAIDEAHPLEPIISHSGDIEDGSGKDFKQSSEDDVAVAQLEAVEELEMKIERDEASKEEYRVKDAYEVAIKVLSTRDDPELKAFTFRTWFLGLGLSAFGAVLAQIYFFKPQTLTVSRLFLLVISYWLGNIMALIPRWGPLKWLNPGPFNIKEHVAIIIMASTAATSATGIQVLSVQDLYYSNEVNPGIAIFTLISSQLIGYGYAGFLMDLLVYPTVCFWPANISPANLFQALHYDNAMSSKRVRLFWIIFTFMFFYEIIPQWIFPLLSAFSIICMIANGRGEVIRNVFGGGSNNEGMGMFSWCFDWNLIGSNCLINPLWTQLNMDIGICLTYILMASVYYGNIWNGLSFPFMSQAIFATDGSQYNQTALLTNGKYDPAKYAELGPAYFSATNALYLITSNLALGAAAVHPWLFYWEAIGPFMRSLNPFNRVPYVVHDPHFEKMKVYKPVPKWWFAAILVIAFGISQATDYTGQSHLPWWTLIVLLAIGFFLCFVYGILAAILGFYEFTSSGAGFFQMITAYMVPGDPIANMYGALYGQTPMNQGIAMLQDLKLGQYIKLAPRMTFLVQLAGTVVGAVLNYVMMLSIIKANRDALLSVSGTRLWSGQNAQGYNSNAIAWGALADPMFSSPHGVYRMVPISLAIGVCLPLPFYLIHRLRPHWGINNINTAIIMQYSCYLSVGINSSVTPAIVLGIVSQWWIRTRYPRWFTKYNYIVAGALDGGTQVISFVLNFAIFGASGTAYAFPTWWGNPSLDDGLSTDRCMAPAN